jgi:hypothetical protein
MILPIGVFMNVYFNFLIKKNSTLMDSSSIHIQNKSFLKGRAQQFLGEQHKNEGP